MNPEDQTKRWIMIGAAALLTLAAVTAGLLLLKPIILSDDAGAALRSDRLPLPDMRLDLNKASAEELTLLPGIGPALADRIVSARRDRGGSFQSIEDLREVSGMGEGRIVTIQPHVVISPAP